jgi:hypothetical protein
MSGKRASGRNAGRVSYAEPVADFDEEDVDAEFDEGGSTLPLFTRSEVAGTRACEEV